jgi:hypothetical protein
MTFGCVPIRPYSPSHKLSQIHCYSSVFPHPHALDWGPNTFQKERVDRIGPIFRNIAVFGAYKWLLCGYLNFSAPQRTTLLDIQLRELGDFSWTQNYRPGIIYRGRLILIYRYNTVNMKSYASSIAEENGYLIRSTIYRNEGTPRSDIILFAIKS